MLSKSITKAKVKQIFHSYFPLIFIFLFPKSFLGVFFALAYAAFSVYVYLGRNYHKMPEITYEYYLVNSVVMFTILALHINAI